MSFEYCQMELSNNINKTENKSECYYNIYYYAHVCDDFIESNYH